MDTAFVIGNGESRPIFPIQDLKSKGIIYGCNAIYRDNPELCDHIVAVNQPMYDELKAWHDQNKAIMNIPVDQLVGKENHMKKLVDPKSIAKVNDIVKALQDKQTMPPIHVRRLKNGYQILDGHHRFWGHRKAGANSIKAKIFNHFHRIRSISIYHMEPCTFSDPAGPPRCLTEPAHPKIHGPKDISAWNYICDGDKETDTPDNLKLYRMWRGGDIKKGNGIRTIDFSLNRGSGMSAVLMAAESGIQNVVMLAFDILGSRQWERDTPSRAQNNMYKNTINYPSRMSMKAYLKYEWMYQLRQIIRKHPDTNFHFINRKEYIEGNAFLRWYFDQPNIKTGIYADLRRWVDGARDDIKWMKL